MSRRSQIFAVLGLLAVCFAVFFISSPAYSSPVDTPCPVEPPTEPPGPCGPLDTTRRDFILDALNATDTPDLDQICRDYNADPRFTQPPNECVAYPNGPYIGIIEWYYALCTWIQDCYAGGPITPPYPPAGCTQPAGDSCTGPWEFITRVCDENLPWPTENYCVGERAGPPICTPGGGTPAPGGP